MNNIFRRRSVRKFLPDPVGPDKIERILRAAMQAPSAHNRQPWEFLVITDARAREEISEMSPYAKMVKNAPAVIAVLADLKRAKPQGTELDWWVEDLSACVENILLQTVDEGLGAVWLGWHPHAERVKVFADRYKLPGHILPFAMVALGYPESPEGPGGAADRFEASRIHYETYSPA